jgi:hypothetical protein
MAPPPILVARFPELLAIYLAVFTSHSPCSLNTLWSSHFSLLFPSFRLNVSKYFSVSLLCFTFPLYHFCTLSALCTHPVCPPASCAWTTQNYKAASMLNTDSCLSCSSAISSLFPDCCLHPIYTAPSRQLVLLCFICICGMSPTLLQHWWHTVNIILRFSSDFVCHCCLSNVSLNSQREHKRRHTHSTNCEGYGKNLSWPHLTFYPLYFLEELRKTTKTSVMVTFGKADIWKRDPPIKRKLRFNWLTVQRRRASVRWVPCLCITTFYLLPKFMFAGLQPWQRADSFLLL